MEPPPSFIDVFSHELMTDPVIDPEGHTYERSGIEEWLSRNPTSPQTRAPLAPTELIPNRALQGAIGEWKELDEKKEKVVRDLKEELEKSRAELEVTKTELVSTNDFAQECRADLSACHEREDNLREIAHLGATSPWTPETLDSASPSQILDWLESNCTPEFLEGHGLKVDKAVRGSRTDVLTKRERLKKVYLEMLAVPAADRSTHDCVHDCGFEGSFAAVETHEATCVRRAAEPEPVWSEDAAIEDELEATRREIEALRGDLGGLVAGSPGHEATCVRRAAEPEPVWSGYAATHPTLQSRPPPAEPETAAPMDFANMPTLDPYTQHQLLRVQLEQGRVAMEQGDYEEAKINLARGLATARYIDLPDLVRIVESQLEAVNAKLARPSADQEGRQLTRLGGGRSKTRTKRKRTKRNKSSRRSRIKKLRRTRRRTKRNKYLT